MRAIAAVVLSVAVSSYADEPLPPVLLGQEVRSATDMHFLAYHGEDTFAVTVGDQSCTTPCTLRLKPGATKIHLAGWGERELQVVVPHLAAQVRVATGPPSWYLPAGVAFVPGGAVLAVTAWMFGLACGYRDDACRIVNFAGWPIVGIALLITGAVLLHHVRSMPDDANRPEILDDALRDDGESLLDRFALRFSGNGLALSF